VNNNVDITKTDSKGRTGLHLAAMFRSSDTIEKIMAKKLIEIDGRDSEVRQIHPDLHKERATLRS
jgi:hypothetical protein